MAEKSVDKALIEAELKKCLFVEIERLCNDKDKVYSEDFQMALLNSSMRMLNHILSKLSDISSHAKRKKIKVTDILLYFRSRPVMQNALKSMIEDYEAGDASVLSFEEDSD